MPLAVAKISKLALAKGGKFMLPLLGALGLQPPTSFSVSEYDFGSSISLSFSWGPPATGPSPDAFRFVFNNDSLGTVELIGIDTTAAIDGLPFNSYWTANVWSRLLADESQYSAFQYGTTSAGTYP